MATNDLFVQPPVVAAGEDDAAEARERRQRRGGRRGPESPPGALAASLERPKFGIERYLEEQTAAAGGTITGGRRALNTQYTSGPYRGMTPDQAREKMRQAYAALPDKQRAAYERGAQGGDIMSGREASALAGHHAAAETAAGLGGMARRSGGGGGNNMGSARERPGPAGTDGGPGFTGVAGAGRGRSFGMRSEEEVAARIAGSPVSGLQRQPSRAAPVSSERTSAVGMTSAQSEAYKRDAMERWGTGGGSPATNLARALEKPPGLPAGRQMPTQIQSARPGPMEAPTPAAEAERTRAATISATRQRGGRGPAASIRGGGSPATNLARALEKPR
jgi:hypothetical protein